MYKLQLIFIVSSLGIARRIFKITIPRRSDFQAFCLYTHFMFVFLHGLRLKVMPTRIPHPYRQAKIRLDVYKNRLGQRLKQQQIMHYSGEQIFVNQIWKSEYGSMTCR